MASDAWKLIFFKLGYAPN